MSKDLFLQMRAEEVATMYDSSFTKAQAIKTGKRMVDDIIENGEVGKLEFMANLSRLNWVISAAEAEMRSKLELFDTQVVNGVTFTHVNGGETLNYKEDDVYCNLEKQLKERAELLKTAKNCECELYDCDGVEIPKVSTTPRKSSITITTK